MRKLNVQRMVAYNALIWAGLAISPGAVAQDTSGQSQVRTDVGDDIVVTARKREERLIDVPVAVTALGEEAINRYGITDLKALTQNVPALFISPVPTGSGSSINIRGLGSLGADVGVPNEVVFSIDGIPVNRGRAIGIGMLDQSRVEVLKGPQSLFFGKNSPAGVVSIVSQNPGDVLGGYLQASHEFASVRPGIEGAVDLPLGTDLAVRLAGKLTQQRGYVRNTAVAHVDAFGYAPIVQPGATHDYQDGSNEQVGRITIDYDPDGPLRAGLKFTYDRFHANSELGTSETICRKDVTAVTINNGFGGPNIVDAGADCKLDKRAAEGGLSPELTSRFRYSGNGVPFTQTESYIAALPITYETDTVTLTSITGFYGYDTSAFSNSSYSSYLYFTAGLKDTYRQYSQEIRADINVSDSLEIHFGGFYEHSKGTYTASVYFIPLGPDSRTNEINSAVMDGHHNSDSYSLFASADLNLSPTVILSGGARYTHDKKKTRLENVFVNDAFFNLLGFNALQPEGSPIIAPYSSSNVSPEVTLSWHPQPDINIYGAFKTGYKAGGTSIASALAVNTAAGLSFKPEKAIGGEFGVKGVAMDGKLRGDLVIYHYVYKNLQVSALDSSRSPPAFSTVNAAKAVTQGVEVQLTYVASPDLKLRANGSYNDAHYKSFPGATCSTDQKLGIKPGCVGNPGVQDLSGRPLPRAPKWNFNGGFTYDVPVGALTLSFNGDATYNDRFYAADQLTAESYQDAWVRLDAGIKLSSPDGWSIGLSGRNLTDHLVQTFLFDRSGSSSLGGIYSGPTSPAREVTLSASMNF